MRWGRLALAAAPWLLLIAVVCLGPTRGETRAPFDLCIICGEQGTSSLLLNVVLYVPLGFVLARYAGLGWALAGALLLSLAVELTQLWIPGRHSAISDLIANTAGGGIGGALAIRPRAWLLPAPRAARRLTLAASVLAVLAIVATGWLLEPVVPDDQRWFVQWTPELQVPPYPGPVLAARLGETGLPPGLVRDQEGLGELLRGDAPLTARFTVAPAPRALTAVVRIVGDGRKEAFQLAVARDQLVVRRRYRADDLALVRPDLRVERWAGASAPGAAVDVRVEPIAHGIVRVDIAGRATEVGLTAGRGWSLLRYDGRLPPWLLRVGDALWVALLFAPIGWWAVSRGVLLRAGLVPLAVLLVAPPYSALVPTPFFQVLAAALGPGAAFLLRRRVGRWLARGENS